MVWKKIAKDMYKQRTVTIYVHNYKNGYTVNYGQAAMNFKIYKTKGDAIKAMNRYKKLHKK